MRIFLIIFFSITVLFSQKYICKTHKEERGFKKESVIKETDVYLMYLDLYKCKFNNKTYQYKETDGYTSHETYVNKNDSINIITIGDTIKVLHIKNYYGNTIGLSCFTKH